MYCSFIELVKLRWVESDVTILDDMDSKVLMKQSPPGPQQQGEIPAGTQFFKNLSVGGGGGGGAETPHVKEGWGPRLQSFSRVPPT